MVSTQHYHDTGRRWKDKYPLYSCASPSCPFDSTNELAMESHWQRYHEPEPPKLVPTGLLDAYGKPAMREWDNNEKDWK